MAMTDVGVSQWNDPVKYTPSIVQFNFGPYGQYIPGDGLAYCGPTSMLMGLYWLSSNGFTQLAPPTYNGPDDLAAANLEKVIAGLMQTSVTGGTHWPGDPHGMHEYLAACGVSGLFRYESTSQPSLGWLRAHLFANTALNPDEIVLANFVVGWYLPQGRCDPPCGYDLCAEGGHYLVPLAIGESQPAGTITLNNSAPYTLENVSNEPDCNPQIVPAGPMPSGETIQYLTGPSQDYLQIETGAGFLGQGYSAILNSAEAFIISADALPSSGCEPQLWSFSAQKTINTNGGILTVLAPLGGTGGFRKVGAGTLELTNHNALTGDHAVIGGVFASSQTTGSPFGTGAIVLSGGGELWLGPYEPDPGIVSVTIGGSLQGGDLATIVVDAGGGVLQLIDDDDNFDVNFDVQIAAVEEVPSVSRQPGGTLVLAPGGGLARLGDTQNVTAANPPPVNNGMVDPYLVGQDNDTLCTGAFLSYANRFVPAGTNSSATFQINDAQSDWVYQVVNPQTIDEGTNVAVAALQVDLEGEVAGSGGASITVLAQNDTNTAGVILNGGTISAALNFGDAEGVIYTSNAAGVIKGRIQADAGLTVFGPGTLCLTADNSLKGTVNVNSGILLCDAAGSATGNAEIMVNSGATAEVVGLAGAITVNQSGTLNLAGGTVQGDVTIAAIGQTTAQPGGILQGYGTIAGQATVPGVIQSARQAGTLAFAQPATIEGANFFWRPQQLVDDNTSQAGVGWNAMQFDSTGNTIGSSTNCVYYFLDFSLVGGPPDDCGEFWQFWGQSHTWTLITLTADNSADNYIYWGAGNFLYANGQFTWTWPDNGQFVYLKWEPWDTPLTPAELQIARIRARRGHRHNVPPVG
ncbi:hypothetical protein [Mycobacterium sp.]|uniref:hypothetical protein n=1 Tax=Mycobacterium sp. TaxID=1785 RepID=UPI002D73A4A3|nr:hypothetical protein [Mycobacterium sp.]HZA10663.1 hypothetical protein [Mycobacterium sp.]